MNKFLKYALVGALAAFTLVAVGCGGGDKKADNKIDMNKPVIVGVNPGPHAIIMDNVKKIAEKKGLPAQNFAKSLLQNFVLISEFAQAVRLIPP